MKTLSTPLSLLALSVTLTASPLSAALFLPLNGGDWNVPENWNPAVVPNGVDAEATIRMKAADDREVILDQTVSLGRLIVENSTAHRDQLEGDGSVTFVSESGEASIVVGGRGKGFSELNLDGIVTFRSDVRVTVNNATSESEHGAYRIRGTVEGDGGLVKDGVGVLSLTGNDKNYTGPTIIEQGVLRITQSAELASSSGIFVEPGGQLRLVSHGEENLYHFGGRLRINSLGQADGIELPQKGRLGGLRLDPELELREFEDGDERQTGTVTSEIEIAGDSHLHVDGSDNWLRLGGDVLGPGKVYKSGGGTLIFAGDNAALTGGTHLESGTIRVEAGSALGTGPLGFETIVDERLDLVFQNAAQTVSRLDAALAAGSAAVITLGAGHTLTVDQEEETNFGGELAGPGSFVKTGPGELVLSGNQTLTGEIRVDGGVLKIDGNALSASRVVAGDGGLLTGGGTLPPLAGSGLVSPGEAGAAILNAVAFDGRNGLDVDFDFRRAGSPSYGKPNASGNDLLWLSGTEPFVEPLDAGNAISIFLDRATVSEGDVFRGGFVTEATADFLSSIRGAEVRYYVRDGAGTVDRGGRLYGLYDGPLYGKLHTVSENGLRVMELSWTDLGDFSEWREFYFADPAELADETVSGPAGDPNGDGLANLVAYALDLGPREEIGPERLSAGVGEAERLVMRFYREVEKTDIAYLVETSTNLRDWTAVFDSRIHSGPNSAGELHEVVVPDEPASDSRFVRLRIVQL